MTRVTRGDIYLVDLSNYMGSEQGGIRPAVVVQNDVGNTYAPTTVICPMTSKQKNLIPTHTVVTPLDSDISRESTILCEQVRVIDKKRLRRRIGTIHSTKVIEDMNNKIRISLGLI